LQTEEKKKISTIQAREIRQKNQNTGDKKVRRLKQKMTAHYEDLSTIERQYFRNTASFSQDMDER
jgi:hypothetical protein